MEFIPKIQAIAVFDANKAVHFFQRFTFGQKRTPEFNTKNAAVFLEKVHKHVPSFFEQSRSAFKEKFFRNQGSLYYTRVVEDLILCIETDTDENEIIIAKVAQCIVQSINTLIRDRCALRSETFAIDIDTFCFVVDAIIDDGVLLTTNTEKVVKQVKPFVLTKCPSR